MAQQITEIQEITRTVLQVTLIQAVHHLLTARAAVWYTVAGLSMAGAAGVILVDRKKKKLSK